ncbi:hypothetical protein DRO69_06555 [Candidatus Bathyarchaeota archaeon]|nr:MAG: hypothetical protein DRO69_06555 [Candidatus Bathyarchaeota archaeon]
MSFRDRLRVEILSELYERDWMSISDLAGAVGVHWKTVQRLVNQLDKDGYVSISKMETFPFTVKAYLTERRRQLASDIFSIGEGKLGKADRLLLMSSQT